MSQFSSKTLAFMIPQVINVLQEHVKTTNGLAKPMELIGVGMQFIERYSHLTGTEKKELFVKSIEAVANGEDGVSGTEDDIIPQKTVETIKIMIENNLVEQTIDLIVDITKGKYDINQAIKKVVDVAGQAQRAGCFNLLFKRK